MSAGGNIQPASAAGLQTYSRLRCPRPPLREAHGTSSAADPRPRALPRPRPRPLPRQPMARERGHVCCPRRGALSAPAASRPRFLCKREVLVPAGTWFFRPARRGVSLLATSHQETAEPCRPAAGERGTRAAWGAAEESDENCGIRWASNWHTLLPPAPGTLSSRTGASGPDSAHLPAGLAQFSASIRSTRRPAGRRGPRPAPGRAPACRPLLGSPPAPSKRLLLTANLFTSAIGSYCFQHQI